MTTLKTKPKTATQKTLDNLRSLAAQVELLLDDGYDCIIDATAYCRDTPTIMMWIGDFKRLFQGKEVRRKMVDSTFHYSVERNGIAFKACEVAAEHGSEGETVTLP